MRNEMGARLRVALRGKEDTVTFTRPKKEKFTCTVRGEKGTGITPLNALNDALQNGPGSNPGTKREYPLPVDDGVFGG